MPLKKTPPPPEFSRALAAGLRDFTGPDDPVRSQPTQDWFGLNVFTLQIRHLNEGVGAATPAGWRFLSGGEVAADVVAGKDGELPRMTSLLRDPLVDRAAKAVREVENLPEVARSDYELRVLRVPGILIEAFWLISTQGGTDLLVPALTKSNRLKRMQAYTVGDFLEIARTLARDFLEFDRIEPD